ncbi:MAG: diguanylate cyclase domain-containing protein [Burkholderiales bacterium]
MSWQKNGLHKVIEQIPVGVAVTLPDGRLEYANPHLHHLLGLEAERLQHVSLAKLRGKETSVLEDKIRRQLLTDGAWQGETEFMARTGAACHVLESVYPLHDEHGKVTHFIHFLQDISALKRAEMLSSLAFYDSLTGLPNRNLFNDRLAQTVAGAQRSGSGFAVLYIDIDRFKQVNDRLGHDGGDELLRQVATRLRQGLRQSDTVARLGGDEFVAILEDVTEAGMAVKVVEKLMMACCGGYRVRNRWLQVAISIGVSFYPKDARDMEALLHCADVAMYRAKAVGGRCYVLQQKSAVTS